MENQSKAAEHAHESPKSMTIPLVILAIFAVIAGYVGIPFLLPGKYSIAKFISGGMHLPEAKFNIIPMIISVVVGLIRNPACIPYVWQKSRSQRLVLPLC